jgi:serine/threonine protein kinase
VELFEADLQMLNNDDLVYLSAKGEDFNYSSVLADYDIKDILGEGGFGKVYLAIDRQTNNKVAIKFMDVSHYLSHASQIEEIYREADALQKLDHNNIIHLYKAFVQKKEVIMIMEHAGGGELQERIEAKGSLCELDARDIFRQCVNAISYCHNRGLIHRDLKLENVLFKEKGGFIIKIVDFGIAGVCKAQRKDKTDAGTLHYMSPEVLSRSNINAGPAIDVWALGIMLYVMVLGELPFNGDSEDEIVEEILKKKLKFNNTKPISSEIQDLLHKVLTKDAEKRITMFEIQNHAWMEMMDEDLEQSIENSKTAEEEEKKKDDDDIDDLEYLSKLKIDSKSQLDNLSPKDTGSSTHKNKKGNSPRVISPRASKNISFNGSIKKGKHKVIKKKKAKPSVK